MITLILHPGPQAKSLKFDKTTIIIGNDTGGQADVVVPGESIQKAHIKIVKENDGFVAINVSNDPFTSLNGSPFGKRALKTDDLLEIGSTVIQIKGLEKEENFTLKEENLFTRDELESVDIDALMREVEQLESETIYQKDRVQRQEDKRETQKTLDPPQPEEKAREHGERKDVEKALTPDYLDDFDNEHPHWNHESEEAKVQFENRVYTIHWIKLLIALFSLAILAAAIFSVLYFRASGKNSEEENKIAAGISDIAMAITHARLNHITPNNRNWADSDFILNNLSIVLPPDLSTQAHIDNEGRFSRHPYILRVYTSTDMSRFLVIAQPSPNLLQWLLNKATIVIDSATMELRKISDIKNLNRLLSNPNPLEGKNGVEISRVIKGGKRMQPASLGGKKNQWGFSPPKALGFIRPGAQYYIYNAPRYYPLGESLLKKALLLNQNPENIDEIPALQAEIKEISQFRDIVLYTSQDLQRVIDAQKVLTIFSPDSDFLIAYVKLNPKGYIASSHLLMNAAREMMTSELEQMSSNDVFFKKRTSLLNYNQFETSKKISLETAHPLYLKLQALAAGRTRALTPIATKIAERLNQENQMMTPDFAATVDQLLNEYKTQESELSSKIKQEAIKLHQEYSEVPFEKFMEFLQVAKLSSVVDNMLGKQHSQAAVHRLTEEDIEAQFEKITRAQTMEQLDNTVQESTKMLSLGSLPDPNHLIKHQERIHDTVLQKLSHFLLSPTSIYAKKRPEEKEGAALKRIVKNAWITDPDEKEFFLTEFEYLRGTRDE
ncbi:MAG: FHA domain-containing protein [Waddliaceae bacterium]